MPLRTITYTVTMNEISPRSVQNAGIQGEHNATEVVYILSEELLNALSEMEGEALFRVQTTDGAGGYHSSEFLILDAQARKIKFLLGEEITSPGGICNLHLVISKIINTDEEETIYSFPAKVRFTHSNHEGEIEEAHQVSVALKRALTAEETAVKSAVAAESSEETAKRSAVAAENSAKEAEAYAEKAKMSVSSVLACEEATEAAESAAASAADSAKAATEAFEIATDAAKAANSAADLVGENIEEVADTVEENLRNGEAFIDKLKEQNNGKNFKVWVGTTEEYEAEWESLRDTLCIITDEEDIRSVVGTISQALSSLADLHDTDFDNISGQLEALRTDMGGLSGRVESAETALSDKIAYSGGTMTGKLTLNGIGLTNGVDYGDTLPTAGVAGQLFFKKV